MINRINLILQAKNITAKQFAEEIGIQPSGMSHILGGRNNPSLDFVSKVLRRYPEIDANWLLLGRGQMYGASAVPTTSTLASAPATPTLFGPDFEAETESPFINNVVPSVAAPQPSDEEKVPIAQESMRYMSDAEVDAESPAAVMSVPTEPAPQPLASEPVPGSEQCPTPCEKTRRLVRMLLIYSDNTFAEYRPQ